jgi:hypothetical protein
MNLLMYFVPLFLAGALMASPAKALADKKIAAPTNSDSGVVEESTTENPMNSAQQLTLTEPLEVAIAYCYLGSIMDDQTGDVLDLYGLCDDGSTFDIA